MDSASYVMADVGFHHLSMRKLAAQLGMTASNIYNYFPNKETLFVHTRRRGFELVFMDISEQMSEHLNPRSALFNFAGHLIQFAQRYPGYYQLMFQPPRLSLNDPELVDRDILVQVDRLADEWQSHLMTMLADAVPALGAGTEARQKQLALFFVSSLHGLIDTYYYKALPKLLSGVDLIPDDIIETHIDWLLSSLERQAEGAH